MTSILPQYASSSGRLDAVFTIEIQTMPELVDGLLDAIMQVHPLAYGLYQRNASVTATGYETSQPMAGSTTATHAEGFKVGDVEPYPVVELKVSIERELHVLERVMSAILEAHHYEEPVIFVTESWASRSAYDPNRDNPNRWWNNGIGMPNKLS